MKYIRILGLVIILGCSDNVSTPIEEELSAYDKITHGMWEIESIQIKEGTHDPDENVPSDKITIIDTGKVIKGTIVLMQDSTIQIQDNESEYYFSYYNELCWELTEENFLRFKRYDALGDLILSFGYSVRFMEDGSMQWYAEYIGIEGGEISIKIITLNNLIQRITSRSSRMPLSVIGDCEFWL